MSTEFVEVSNGRRTESACRVGLSVGLSVVALAKTEALAEMEVSTKTDG